MTNYNEDQLYRFGLCGEPDLYDTSEIDNEMNEAEDNDLDLSDASDEKTVMD